MNPQEQSVPQKIKRKRVALLPGILIIVILLAVLCHNNIIRFSQKIFPSKKSVPQIPSDMLHGHKDASQVPGINICSEQHTGYPLTTDILTTKADPNLGVYQGTVSKVDISGQLLEVSSTPSGSVFSVHVNKSVPIYDMYHSRVTDISGIQPETKVFISFPCVQYSKNMSLSQIQMVL